MNKVPQWALWGVVGAVGGVVAGYVLYLLSDPPRYRSSLEYWLGGGDPLLWVVIGTILGGLLGFLLTRKPPSPN